MAGIGGLARRMFGSSNDRKIKRLRPMVDAINALEDEIAALSDDDLRAKTDEFRAQLADGTKIDDLLVPAFAVVREAAKRALGMRPFDVQLIGGIVLHEALHGLTWQILSGQRDVVEYGVKWKVLTPYAHMKARIPISAYRTGIWMPGFVVGLIPVLVALLIGNGTLLWFGILFVWGAGGDMMILWLLRGIPDTAEIEDHPERVGCYVWLLEESAEETPV